MEAQLRVSEFKLYTAIRRELSELVRSRQFDEADRQDLLGELEVICECTEWPELRKRVASDLLQFGAAADTRVAAEIGL